MTEREAMMLERQAFEKWVRRETRFDLERRDDGQYTYGGAHDSWLAWKAGVANLLATRSASNAQVLMELAERLHKSAWQKNVGLVSSDREDAATALREYAAHLSRAAEPVDEPAGEPEGNPWNTACPTCGAPVVAQERTGAFDTWTHYSYAHPPEPARDSRVIELAAAARFYFDNYCLDEADDWFDEGERIGENTGVTREQYIAANRLRDALAATAQESGE